MGELHGVTQLKPRVIIGGAILKVKKEKEQEFLEKYSNEQTHIGEWGIFNQTYVKISENGFVERRALYYEQKIIDFKISGIYIQIEGLSKHGPDSYNYVDFMNNLSYFLENALFYVDYFDSIDRYEIIDGILQFQKRDEINNFEDYFILNYNSSPQTIARYYAEKVDEIKRSNEDIIKMNSDPKEIYDPEDYEELLDKLNNYKDFLPTDEAEECVSWLKEQIASYQ